MKRTVIAAAGLAFATACGMANAASWSVFVEPGIYGRVAIGGYAEAPVVYEPQPVMVVDDGYGQYVEETVDAAYATDQPPVYLWVPEYQRLHWARYCRDYGAYGVPVYFVDDGWYRANVMRRNWSPEQRSWSQQQWLEQDRLARDRFERQRFEQQRYEQQQRWNDQRAWHDPREGRNPVGRGDDPRGQQQAHWDQDAQNRMRWGSARGYLPQQPQPAQNNPVPRPQPGGQWQQPGGQWQQHGGQWQQGGNAGAPQGNGGVQPGNGAPQPGSGGHGGWQQGGNSGASQGNGGAQPGNGAPQPGSGGHGGWQQGGNAGASQGNAGAQPGSGGHGGWQQSGNGWQQNGGAPGAGNGGQSSQPPSASQPRGGHGQGPGGANRNDGDDRGQERAEHRGAGVERSREGRRDR